MSTGQGKRSVRVADQVRQEIASALLREMGDPHLSTAVVTRVEMTDDLQNARVYVRLASGPGTEADRKALVRSLRRASGGLRRLVGQRLQLRRAPELAFFFDEGQDASDRIGAILAEIARERDDG